MELVDVKQVDGEPWEVANFASVQFDQAIQQAWEALEMFGWAARGSWLSQQHYWTGSMPDGDNWSEQVAARQLGAIEESLSELRARAATIGRSTSHDPRDF